MALCYTGPTINLIPPHSLLSTTQVYGSVQNLTVGMPPDGVYRFYAPLIFRSSAVSRATVVSVINSAYAAPRQPICSSWVTSLNVDLCQAINDTTGICTLAYLTASPLVSLLGNVTLVELPPNVKPPNVVGAPPLPATNKYYTPPVTQTDITQLSVYLDTLIGSGAYTNFAAGEAVNMATGGYYGRQLRDQSRYGASSSSSRSNVEGPSHHGNRRLAKLNPAQKEWRAVSRKIKYQSIGFTVLGALGLIGAGVAEGLAFTVYEDQSWSMILIFSGLVSGALGLGTIVGVPGNYKTRLSEAQLGVYLRHNDLLSK